MTFKQPVEIGNLLMLDSAVLFTSSNKGPHIDVIHDISRRLIYVEVVAYVTAPEHRRCRVSNTFNFSFMVDSDTVLPRVVPNSLEQAQRMLSRCARGQSIDSLRDRMTLLSTGSWNVVMALLQMSCRMKAEGAQVLCDSRQQ